MKNIFLIKTIYPINALIHYLLLLNKSVSAKFKIVLIKIFSINWFLVTRSQAGRYDFFPRGSFCNCYFYCYRVLQGSRYVDLQDLLDHLALPDCHFQAVQVLVNFLLDQEMTCQ